jgi:hypothetical protein
MSARRRGEHEEHQQHADRVEVRHESFRTAEFVEVLRSYQAAAVFTD